MRASRLALPHYLVAVVLAAAPSLGAQDHEALVRRGVELRRQGSDAAALEAFSAAYAARPEARLAAQLGATHQALGHWLEAERRLREALAAVGDPWITRNRAVLAASVAEVERHLGTLEVQGDPAGAEVLIDGRPSGRLPLPAPLRVVAGVLTVTLRAEGRSSAVRRVVVEPGVLSREAFDALSPEPQPEPAPPARLSVAPPAEPPSPVVAPARVVFRTVARRDPAPLVLVTLGGAALSVGLTAIIAREGVASTFNAACPSAGATACDGLAAQADGWSVAAAVAVPLGLIAVGVGVWRALAR